MSEDPVMVGMAAQLLAAMIKSGRINASDAIPGAKIAMWLTKSLVQECSK